MSLPDQIAAWLREGLATAGADGFVCGLSGGVDSATAAALAVRAVGSENVLATLMPCHSVPEDAALGQLVADTFAIPTVTVDLSATYDALTATLPLSDHRLAAANIKPRLRMVTLYYFANRLNYLVVGSGNRSELSVGYFTKHGDGGSDLMPLGNLVKNQVRDLARHLDIPREIIDKPPSAGLWEGQTDEAEIGLTYSELDRYLITGEADKEIKEQVDFMMSKSRHKCCPPPIPQF